MNKTEFEQYMKKISQSGIVPGLETMKELLGRLGNPQDKIKVIHIAGTNGKGSILAFCENILEQNGLLVGRYISPSVFCYEEKYQIGHNNISWQELYEYMERIKQQADAMEEDGLNPPTVFEVETALAFLYFSEKNVDYLLLETGMGGRLDATNVVKKPLAVVLASISLDHMKYLGNTIEEITREKAGIIKNDVPVILYPNSEKVTQIVKEICKERQAPLFCVQKDKILIEKESAQGSIFRYNGEKLQIRMLGTHQIYNSVTAFETIKTVMKQKEKADFCYKEPLQSTSWMGRLEKIRENPTVYADGAHNPDAARQLAHFIENNLKDKKISYIMGIFADKNYKEIVRILAPKAEKIWCITPQNERGLDAKVLCEEAKNYCKDCVSCTKMKEAYENCLKETKKEDVILVFGSLSFLKEIYRIQEDHSSI